MTRNGVRQTKHCESLAEVRVEIDQLDRAIVTLLAERGGYVLQAARFKHDAAAVHAPDRVEQVVAGVRALAGELRALPRRCAGRRPGEAAPVECHLAALGADQGPEPVRLRGCRGERAGAGRGGVPLRGDPR